MQPDAASGPRLVAEIRTNMSSGATLGVLNLDVKVPILGEDSGVDQFVFRLLSPAFPGLPRQEIPVWERIAGGICRAHADTSVWELRRGSSNTP